MQKFKIWVGPVALGLWVLTVVALGTMFVRGSTAPGTDGRVAVVLPVGDRDMILSEMRGLLQAVQGVVTALAQEDHAAAAVAARQAGMSGHATTEARNPGVMARLPLPFKQMGMQVHSDFDALASALDQKVPTREALQKLSATTATCVACHSQYRFQAH